VRRKTEKTIALDRAVTSLRNLNKVSPKQPASKKRRDWYPYYAGFTEQFVEAVIDQYLGDANSVLDPWSGSGTTTVTCLRRGLRSSGIDLNPAVTVMARARLNATSTRERLLELGERIVAQASKCLEWEGDGELLGQWMTRDAVARVHALRGAIHQVLNEPLSDTNASTDLGVDRLSPAACFFYCALFGSVRDLLARYGTTNPMWLKPPESRRNRIRPSSNTLEKGMVQQMRYLEERLSLRREQAPRQLSPFKTGNAGHTGLHDGSFDAVLTSPPYATRVDYVKGTLPELAVLGADQAYLRNLRKVSTGSPTVDGARARVAEVRSDSGRSVLSAIEAHESKGSLSYYLPWMANYLTSLQSGLEEIDRTVRSDGVVCIVVQDSYYKEVHVDLQRVVTEMFAEMGRTVSHRHDYSAPNPRRGSGTLLNGGAAKVSSQESLLVFEGSAKRRAKAVPG